MSDSGIEGTQGLRDWSAGLLSSLVGGLGRAQASIGLLSICHSIPDPTPSPPHLTLPCHTHTRCHPLVHRRLAPNRRRPGSANIPLSISIPTLPRSHTLQPLQHGPRRVRAFLANAPRLPPTRSAIPGWIALCTPIRHAGASGDSSRTVPRFRCSSADVRAGVAAGRRLRGPCSPVGTVRDWGVGELPFGVPVAISRRVRLTDGRRARRDRRVLRVAGGHS